MRISFQYLACSAAALSLTALTACGDGLAGVDSGRRPDVPNARDGNGGSDVVEIDVPSGMDVSNGMDAPSSDRPTVGDTGVITDVIAGLCRSNADCGRLSCVGILACGGLGRCEQVGACPGVLAPVCGCDGRDYSNRCEASRAGVGATDGRCLVPDSGVVIDAAPGSCSSNAQCLRGQVCRNINRCGGTGVCEGVALCGRPSPDAAVCGCDNMNYASSCEAFNVGVGVASMGACPIVNPGQCRSNVDCNRGLVCTGIAACGGLGRCNLPSPCIDIFAPVCGCDNMTYSNSCVAQNSGVGVARDGACGVVMDCRVDRAQGCCYQDADCARGYCAPVNSCVGGSATGVCVTTPPPDPRVTRCWRDSDCGPRGRCANPQICPCGARCLVPDSPGTCG